ncbi:peptidylprolyl isomerase [Henriciella aquimarina]|uniref:peptidylprolyl isomerase n=1 Tax=Henriciella aquimarina TaxID=545261 RepID=UPI000A0291D9|nr:peptidylprolyl isomerase [Henriciella aquimarina]
MKSCRFLLFALALTGLVAIPGCGENSSSPSRRAVGFDASTAAVVNGEPIYISDVELEAVAQGRIEPGEAFGPDHTEYQMVLDQLIDQKLLAQEAVRRGLDRSPKAQRRLETARERLLGNFLMENLVSTEVTDAAIDKMYDEQVKLQQLDDEVRIRHILVETEEEAQDVLDKARSGEDFTSLAFEYSKDTRTRLDGGSFGWVSPNEMIDPFPSVIADTSAGEMSEPFESEQGWHILKVEERRTKPPKTKEEMRPEIVTYLTFTEISKILRQLRADASIQQRDGGPPDLSYLDDPSDLGDGPAAGEETAVPQEGTEDAAPTGDEAEDGAEDTGQGPAQ